METDAESSDDVQIPPQAIEVLSGLRIGTLSFARRDGAIGVTPIAVLCEENVLKISSPRDTEKVRSLRLDPRAAVCVIDPSNVNRYVEVRGVAAIADDVQRRFVTRLAREHMSSDEYPFESSDVARVIITIDPRRVVLPRVHGRG